MIGPPSLPRNHYVPLLRVADAELAAMKLEESIGLDGYTPIFSLRPKQESDQAVIGVPPKKTRIRRPSTAADIAKHVTRLSLKIANWSNSSSPARRCFVDISEMNKKHGAQLMNLLLGKAAMQNDAIVPVTNIHSSTDHVAIRAHNALHEAGFALRIDGRSLPTKATVLAILKSCDVDFIATDIILDFGLVTKSDIGAQKLAQRLSQVQDVVGWGAWRSIVFLGGSMPKTVQFDKAFTDVKLERYDWELWLSLASAFKEETVAFGDYGTMHPLFEVPDFARSPSPYVKYTGGKHFLYLKRKAIGRVARQNALRDICAELVKSSDYRACGPQFSVGDREFNEVATGGPTTRGGAAGWIRMMIGHHVRFVTTQLAKLP